MSRAVVEGGGSGRWLGDGVHVRACCCARRGCRGRAGSVDCVARGVRSSLPPPPPPGVWQREGAGVGATRGRGGERGRGRRGHPFPSCRPVTRRWGWRRRGDSAGRGPVLASPPPPTFRRPLVASAAATTAAVASIGVGGPSPPPRSGGLSPVTAIPLLRVPVASDAALLLSRRARHRGARHRIVCCRPPLTVGRAHPPAAPCPRFVTRATRGGVTRSVVTATGVGARAGQPQ